MCMRFSPPDLDTCWVLFSYWPDKFIILELWAVEIIVHDSNPMFWGCNSFCDVRKGVKNVFFVENTFTG